jgi:tetratricopeptide (TPR) repeat protein
MARPVVHEPGETPPRVTSSLYSRYYGFLIGQALALTFADGAGEDPGYAARRVRLLTCLRELDVDAAIPESPDHRGGVTHAALLTAILPRLAQRDRELAEFAILGGLLVHYAAAARRDADTAAALRLEIERLRGVYDLPAVDGLRQTAVTTAGDPERLQAMGLAYLGDVLSRVPAESDTALVLLPAAPPYDEYYASFHRPALEHCGYRALRAWGGLEGEAAAGVTVGLLAKVALVWADVSETDHGIVAAMGAAQALGRPGMIVAREDRAATVPRHIGRDPVIRYDPRAADWPDGPVLLMSACLAGIALAAERGDRLRLTPSAIEQAFDEVSQALGRILLPTEARDAQRRGRRAMDAGDLALAAASFDEAYRLGLHDDETRLWRGWARLGLGRFVEASADLDAVVGADPLARPVCEWRPIAAYLRAVLREAQGDLAGALHDFELAVALGLTDAEVRGKRDELAARVPS